MKAIYTLLISVCLIAVSVVTAHAQLSYKSQFPMTLDATGTITDASGAKVATITRDTISGNDIIEDKAGERIGLIDANGKVVGFDGKTLGKAAKNGEFHSMNGETEYTVKPAENGNGFNVYDRAGKHVLIVPAYYRHQAGSIAYMYKKTLIEK